MQPSTFALSDVNSIKYYINDNFRKKIDLTYGNIISLNFDNQYFCNQYVKINDVHNLEKIYSLDIRHCPDIKDIGTLRELKKLIINEYVEGIHLLKELEILVLNNKLIKYSKMERRIKKLKQINPIIKIEVRK